jgi:hypothetical protein
VSQQILHRMQLKIRRYDYVMTFQRKEEMDGAEWVNGFDYVMTFQRMEWGGRKQREGCQDLA